MPSHSTFRPKLPNLLGVALRRARSGPRLSTSSRVTVHLLTRLAIAATSTSPAAASDIAHAVAIAAKHTHAFELREHVTPLDRGLSLAPVFEATVVADGRHRIERSAMQ